MLLRALPAATASGGGLRCCSLVQAAPGGVRRALAATATTPLTSMAALVINGDSSNGVVTADDVQVQATTTTTNAKLPSPASAPVRVAVAQMTSTNKKEDNFHVCCRLAHDAAAAGCKLLCLPECHCFIGEQDGEALAAAEPLDGPSMGRYCALARDTKMWLSLGGFQETSADPSRLNNTHVLIDSEGHKVAVYRKIHLFDVDIPDGPRLMESKSTKAGSSLTVADSPAGRLGLSVCYDLRFPQLFQQLRFQQKAQVLLIPAAFTKPTGEAHWEVLLRARAIETQCYVLAAAQTGRHNAKRESYGHAMIIDPWGKVVAATEDPLATGLAIADLDLSLVDAVRMRMPVESHRRYDIYGVPAIAKSAAL
eukprot:jgi/Chlat1/4921/Chrsp31S04833